MKKALTLTIAASMLLSCAACQTTPESSDTATDVITSDTSEQVTETTSDPAADYDYLYQYYATLTPEEIVARLTLEQKAAQMIQPVIDYLDMDADRMSDYCYGSIYGGYGANVNTWRQRIDNYQQMAIESETGIPFILGQDDVHGVGYCIDAVYFPHNIGLGAANDEDLMYQMGLITADESRLCHMMWNLYPCVAQSNDPRWGRTYECMSSDLDIITNLSTAYTRGLIDGGVIACGKHFFGDGNVMYGTGETSGGEFRYIDRGDCDLTDEEISELLAVYQAQIDAGVQTIMVSYTSLNGVKMHEQGDYIWMLKDEMGFEGFIVSDYDAIQNTSFDTYEEQVINAVNCGIDMFMLSEQYDEARVAIIDGVNNGDITMERIDDAVTRIIRVKMDAGVFDDPLCENMTTTAEDVGSPEYRAVAEQLVEESLVLIKNDNDVLPLAEGTSVYILGPAADNAQAQCGGWTIGWVASPGRDISGVTTILEAFETYAEDYGIEVITDPERASEADVVLLCVGEESYAEWYGDSPDLSLTGMHGLEGNTAAINEAAALGKPTVTCIIAGRNVILDEDDYANWDSVVMCYLPGSEGKGISDVLCGCADFTGRLPSPWYGDIDQILTDDCFLPLGYGLSYPEDFTPRTEPEAVYEIVDHSAVSSVDMGDITYEQGYLEGDVYHIPYADVNIIVPEGYSPLTSDEWVESNSMADQIGVVGDCITSDALMSGVNIIYINTDIIAPDDDDFTLEECYDLMFHPEGLEVVSSETVTIGDYEWLRLVDNDEYQAGEPWASHFYLRRQDDSHIIAIYMFDAPGEDREPGYFDSWFAEGSDRSN